MEFKSQICTDINQSRKLLELGLKKETADMTIVKFGELYCEFVGEVEISCGTIRMNGKEIDNNVKEHIPAWSLHRLLSLIPKDIEFQVYPMCGRNYTLPIELQITSELDICYIKLNREEFTGFYGTDIYDSAIRCIEWLIKEGYFNKDYLEGKK